MVLRKPGSGLLLVLALLVPTWAQTTAPAGTQAAQATASQPDDELARMRDDLNKLDSLNLNMSSEIEFLHDQNLQILLRTNSQMWGVLIRDLRRQVEREAQRRSEPRPSDHRPTTKPDR